MGSELGIERRWSGFTLIELLVVIGLIALLAAGVGLALDGRNEGAAMRSGELTAAELFRVARSQAVLLQTRSRLIVLDDPEDPERHLRQLGIVVEDPGLPDHWRAVSDGAVLPLGIGYRREYSTDDGSFRLRFPLRSPQAAGAGDLWRYFEFDSRGRLAAGALRMFALGPLIRETGAAEQLPLGGFAIFPLGGVVFPEEPEALR